MSNRQRRRLSRRRSGAGGKGLVGSAVFALTLIPAAAAEAQTYTVTNLNNSGAGSLREAITDANADNTSVTPDDITFASHLTGVIHLRSQLKVTTDQLVIDGPGARRLTVNAASVKQVPALVSSEDLELEGLSLNSAGGHGFIDATSTLLLSDDSFFNDANTNGSGGALHLDSFQADVTISGCTFNRDSAKYGGAIDASGGGAVYHPVADTIYSPTVTILDSTVAHNSATRRGGGLDLYGANATVIGSTISNNTVSGRGGDGGGIASVQPVYSPGGGVHYVWGQVDLMDSILGENQAAHDPDLYLSQYLEAPQPFLASSSLVQHVPSGVIGFDTSDITGRSPDLGPLQNNGGSTNTELPAANSPVINAGEAFSQTVDQRGLPRTVEFPGVANSHGGDGTDMGAVELQPYVTGLSRGSGRAGQQITIHGSGFKDVSVYFGSIKATKVKIKSDTQILVTVPHGSGRVAVTVHSSAGSSPTVSGDRFRYT